MVFVRSPEGEQEFELAAGESVTVTGITGPIEVGAVSRQSQQVRLFGERDARAVMSVISMVSPEFR